MPTSLAPHTTTTPWSGKAISRSATPRKLLSRNRCRITPRPLLEPQQQPERTARRAGVGPLGAGGLDQFGDRLGGEPADTEVVELVVGRHHSDVGVPFPGAQSGEQAGVLVDARVQRGAIGDGQRADQTELDHGAVLVGQLVEIEIQIGDVAGVVDLPVQGEEPPAADMVCLDRDRVRRVVLVDVDHQHVAGVGFHVVIVGDFRRPGIPDPPAVAHARARVLVSQRHIVHRPAVERLGKAGHPDQRRLGGIRVEDVDAAVGEHDAGGPVRGQIRQHRADQIGGRRLGAPRGRDELHARPHVPDAVAVEHHDVVRTFGPEQRAGVDRRSVERIVIAGQQVDRNADGAHGFQRLADDLRRQVVVSKTSPATTTNSAPVFWASAPRPATASRRAAE